MKKRSMYKILAGCTEFWHEFGPPKRGLAPHRLFADGPLYRSHSGINKFYLK